MIIKIHFVSLHVVYLFMLLFCHKSTYRDKYATACVRLYMRINVYLMYVSVCACTCV